MGEKEIYKAIFNSAPDAVVVVDGNGRIIMTNDQVKKLFGYDKAELIGRQVECLLPEKFRQIHVSHRDNYSSKPVLREMGAGRELLAKRKDGSEFFVEISLSPLKTSQGWLTSASLRDVSERIRTKRQLEQSLVAIEKKNKELEQFAYVASHDLREPLHTIMSLVDLIKLEYKEKLDSSADKYLQFILQTTSRMEALIKDLLDYSRIGTEQEQQKVNCNEIVDDVLLDMNALIKKTHTEVEKHTLPTLKAYPTELRQLFQNLITNAIKFRRPDADPRISIKADLKDTYWQFAVADNGIGIDEKYKEKIFMIFQRLHSRREYEGTGIGLAQCRKIVESHGGTIWVKSVPNEGSTFFFTIPKGQ